MTHPSSLPVLVVADDHTGANATAGRLAARGVEAVTVSATDQALAALAAHRGPASAGAAVVSTSSRHIDPQEAMLAVRDVVDRLPDAALVAKRIDTTLRGNIGAELDAVLRARRDQGRPSAALVVPAHPDGGRTTVGGVQLVGGQPVSASEAAADARRPVRISRVASLLREQLERSVAEVDIDTVRGDGEDLVAALSIDADVIVADAVDDGDLTAIAHAAVAVATQRRRHWVPCDPGPFTAAYADAAGMLGADPGVVFAVLGSVTSVTRGQLAALERQQRVALVPVDVTDLDADALGRRLASEAERDRVDVVVAATAPSADDVRTALGPTDADRIAAGLGRAARGALDRSRAAGLYLTGGDVTAGALTALESEGLTVDREILPLAVLGQVRGGPFAETLVATKGGLVGGPDAAARCVQELRAAARARIASRSTAP